MMIIDKLYKDLLDALKLVVASADVQIASLPRYEKVPEEIVLIYSDAYISVPQLMVHNRITEDTALLLDELDKQFEQMAEHKKLWTNEQLEKAGEWKTIRGMAAKILATIEGM